jgi:dolichyl-phosphate-mannose-protein mannosyltransferase
VAQFSNMWPLQPDNMLMYSSQEASITDSIAEWEWVFAPILFTLLAFFTRNYKIGLSPIVTWDEAQYVDRIHIHLCKTDPI